MFFSNIILFRTIMTLPEAFIEDIRPYLSEQELGQFCHALAETESTNCIRINKLKMSETSFADADPIGWNPSDGRYLKERPNFTLDPLMHAGCYYVQEASSQFVTHVVRRLITGPVTALDLCAAPGGKSTALLSAIPIGSVIVSNEIDRRRARILAENITKWGNPYVTVTSNAPADFTPLTHQFDLILTDVPCSGEGMFRKDEGAVKDWSPTKVEKCTTLQREILTDIWPTLKPGGLLIYSTCTFNVHEDEEMLDYICDELGAEAISIPVEEDWNIHKPLKGYRPCYRFMPHYTKGEGLFMAVVRKNDEADELSAPSSHRRDKKNKSNPKSSNNKAGQVDLKRLTPSLLSQITIDASLELTQDGTLRAIPSLLSPLHQELVAHGLYLLQSGIEMGTIKGRDVIPAHALALSTVRSNDAFPLVEVELEVALNYLRHEAITLPEDAPKGYVIVTYMSHPLGFVKNLGNRCNTLYPQEWRIRFL